MRRVARFSSEIGLLRITYRKFYDCSFRLTVILLLVALRVNYSPTDVLDIDKLLTSDPIHLFKLWFDEARTCEKIEEPNAMTLATANK